MGLGDIAYKQGNVKSSKDVTDVNLPTEGWRYFMHGFDKATAEHLGRIMSEKDIKAIVEYMDEELQKDSPWGWVKDCDWVEDRKAARDELVKHLD